jgi:hypothetical protein
LTVARIAPNRIELHLNGIGEAVHIDLRISAVSTEITGLSAASAGGSGILMETWPGGSGLKGNLAPPQLR